MRCHASELAIDDVTPDLGSAEVEAVRGPEVARYLADHPEVTRFVILDDHDDLDPYLDRLVLVDRAVGITDADCANAYRMLEGAGQSSRA